MTTINKYIEEKKLVLNKAQLNALGAKKLSRILRNCTEVHSHYTLKDEVKETVFCLTSNNTTYLITLRETGEVYFERLFL